MHVQSLRKKVADAIVDMYWRGDCIHGIDVMDLFMSGS